ncbi:fibrous sheath CABYR-binding protein-like [Gopherus flavomarginatus]|uniref:fibrous sheath CABYR-binding protein-like n=1 Tax=Gopherus flavomarginatus TaxID=286002 RepID=UPI0021CBE161|nr:fibrous sheath CABYR-binding protein-like [Gopherus flavomarginatus]
MGSRLSKRKHLGVPDKSADQKAEKAAMEMEGTPQESPETYLAAETALDATQVMGKAHCTEDPVPGTTEETEIQTAIQHGEAQPSAETTEGNESQPEAQMPLAVPQITEIHLDTETSEHTSEAQLVEESSLDPIDETEAATEHDESSPTGETTEMTETQFNALHDQGTEVQFAGEIHPIEISILKIEDQPPAQNGEETEVPVAMPIMQEALREAEPAVQTPQMMGEAESIVETAVASTDVIAAHPAVEDTQLGKMQLAEIGESQKVTDHAEACSTAELVEVTEAQPVSPSTYKSLQDTEGSQPPAEKSLEPTEVSVVPSAETTKGNESQPEVQMPLAVPQITKTQLDTETSEHTSEAQPVEKSSLDPTDETEAATEHDESSPTGETTEMTETQLNALHDQGTETQFAGEIHPIEISVLKIEDQPPAQNREETEVPVAMPTMQEALREAEPAAQTPQMTSDAESIVEPALASKDAIVAHLAVQDIQLDELQLAEMDESQNVTDHAKACSTAEPMEVTEAHPASPSMYQSLQDTEESQHIAEKSLEITEVSEVQSIARAIEETNEGQQIAQAIKAKVCSIEQTSQKTTEIMIGSQSAIVTTGESGEAQPIEAPSIAEVAEVRNAAKNSEDQPSSETTEVTRTPPIALHVQKTKAVAGEGQPAIETSEVMADPQPTMLGEPDTEARKTVQSTEEIGEGPTALPAVQGILQELLPASEAQQAVEIIEKSLHVTGGTQLLAETKSQNTTENNEAHPIPETEAASVPNTQTPQELSAWPTGETAKAAEGKSTEDMVLDTAKVNEAPPAGENKAHPNTKVREAMEVQAAGTDAQDSHQGAETMKETVTQSTEWSMPESGGAQPTAEAARVQTAAPIAQKSEPATETTAGNSESCSIVQATEEVAVPPVAETEIHIAVPATQELAQDSSERQPIGLHVQETEVQSAAQTAEAYTTALTILKFIKETTEAAAKTTEENEACPTSGTVLETPEEAESLQSLMETTELKIKRGQEPQIPANRTGQEGGEHAAISKEEILKASETEFSVDAESELQQYTEPEDPSASLGASCELPQTLEPSSETQAFQPLESIVTAVDERGVQGEPKQAFSAFETQGRKGEMAIHSDCGPTGSEAVPSKEMSAREASDLIHMA